MAVELVEQFEKFKERVKASRLGVLWVYLSMATMMTVTTSLVGGFVSPQSSIFEFEVSLGQLSLISGVFLAGPLLVVFLLWNWARPAESGVLAFKDEEAMERYWASNLPESLKRARFLQYSGDKSDSFVRSLLNRGASVQLLVKHPSTVDLEIQRDKLRTLEQRWQDCPNRDELEIRYYRENASVKGVSANGKALGLSWYTFQPLGTTAPKRWLYGHSNLHVGFSWDRISGPESQFFENLFDALWMSAQPMWTVASGKISKGHGVAGAKSEHYPAGTISLQTRAFKDRGVDLSVYYPATLNIDVSPMCMSLVRDEKTGHPVAKTLFEINWIDNHPPENFSVSHCWIIYKDQRYAGLIYYPHPETKARHEQNQGIIEVLCAKIPIIAGECDIEIQVNSLEISIFKS